MKEFENKIIKYILILTGIIILNALSIGLIPNFVHQFNDSMRIPALLTSIMPIIINLFFAVILFFDCKKEVRNFYVIPILGAFIPIFGLIFYFIERSLLLKNTNHDK
jgi:hypothetical protein